LGCWPPRESCSECWSPWRAAGNWSVLCAVCLIAVALGHALVHGDYASLRTAAQGTVVQVRPYVKGSADWVVLPLFGALVQLVVGTPALLRGEPDPTHTRVN